jgi:hypothetical protein
MAEMSRVIRDAVAGEQLVEQVLKD